jgi:hypothetical protein
MEPVANAAYGRGGTFSDECRAPGSRQLCPACPWPGRCFDEPSERLRRAGAPSANRFLPVLFTLLAFGRLVAAVALMTPEEVHEP